MNTLKESGNQSFNTTYLANWQSTSLPKPVDRKPLESQQWIEAVYVQKRFHSSTGHTTSQISTPGTNTQKQPQTPVAKVSPAVAPGPSASSRDDSVPQMVPMSSILGGTSPKLVVSPSKSSTGDAPRAAAPEAEVSLLDLSSSPVKNGNSMPEPQHTWDSFEVEATVQQLSLHSEDWAAFGESPEKEAAKNPPSPPTITKWEAFGESPAPPPRRQPPPPPLAVVVQEEPVAVEANEQPSHWALSPLPRPEVPLDVFYPEFEHIRATGILPNGKPVPGYYRPPAPPPMTAPPSLPSPSKPTAVSNLWGGVGQTELTSPVAQRSNGSGYPEIGKYPDPLGTLSTGVRHQLPGTHHHQDEAAPYARHISAASTTLFGNQPTMSAMPYDLTAPAAPKPKSSGNPFAF